VSGRLAPAVTPDTQFFWDGLREHRLLIQRCAGCGVLRHPPRPMCPACRSLEWDAVEASGRGTVRSCVIPHHPPLPWFPEPYVVAIVDLDEGVRLVTNVVGVDPHAVTIGMAVQVRFETFDDGLVLPLFAPEPETEP
jgi:uncharacterized OB-fold protein